MCCAGSAYNYEDQDTSSDSDDEVLRKYQQNAQQRQPSFRSTKSGASKVSKASKGECCPWERVHINMMSWNTCTKHMNFARVLFRCFFHSYGLPFQ